MKCLKCWKQLELDAEFCHHCGEKIQKETKCIVCNAELKSDANFCSKCGTKVASREKDFEEEILEDWDWEHEEELLFNNTDDTPQVIIKDREAYTLDPDNNLQYFGEVKTRHSTTSSTNIIIRTSNNDNYDILVDESGQIIRERKSEIIDYAFDEVGILLDNSTGEWLTGLIDLSTARVILTPEFGNVDVHFIAPVNSNKRIVSITTKMDSDYNDLMGLYDVDNGWVLEPKNIKLTKTLNDAGEWSGLVQVCYAEFQNEEYETEYYVEVIDMDHKSLIKYKTYDEYSRRRSFLINGEHYFPFKDEKGVGLIGLNNKKVFYCNEGGGIEYLDYEGYIRVEKNREYALYDLNKSKYVIPFGEFESFGLTISDGGLKAKKNNLWGFIDISGKIIVPCTYDRIRDEYTIDERPTIWVDHQLWSGYINYKNETDGNTPVTELLK